MGLNTSPFVSLVGQIKVGQASACLLLNLGLRERKSKEDRLKPVLLFSSWNSNPSRALGKRLGSRRRFNDSGEQLISHPVLALVKSRRRRKCAFLSE